MELRQRLLVARRLPPDDPLLVAAIGPIHHQLSFALRDVLGLLRQLFLARVDLCDLADVFFHSLTAMVLYRVLHILLVLLDFFVTTEVLKLVDIVNVALHVRLLLWQLVDALRVVGILVEVPSFVQGVWLLLVDDAVIVAVVAIVD